MKRRESWERVIEDVKGEEGSKEMEEVNEKRGKGEKIQMKRR